MTLIIGLGHKARQGKDYVSKYMQETLPSSIQIYSFAKELKLHCKKYHDEILLRWQLEHQTKQIPSSKDDPIYGYTRLLQWYGTDVARRDNPNIWVDKLEQRIILDNPEIAVITDVRFPNEYSYIKEKSGYTIEVCRMILDGNKLYQYTDSDRDSNHPSEIALNDYNFDYIISVRDGDLVSLKAKALAVLANIMIEEKKKYDDILGGINFSDPTSTH